MAQHSSISSTHTHTHTAVAFFYYVRFNYEKWNPKCWTYDFDERHMCIYMLIEESKIAEEEEKKVTCITTVVVNEHQFFFHFILGLRKYHRGRNKKKKVKINQHSKQCLYDVAQ